MTTPIDDDDFAKLDAIRKLIDHVDASISSLLEERVELARHAQRCRPAGRDRERENEVVRFARSRAKELTGDDAEDVFRAIIEVCSNYRGGYP